MLYLVYSLSLSYFLPAVSVRLCQGKKREEDGTDGRSQRQEGVEVADGKVDLGDLYGAAAGWVEARTSCPHLGTMPPAGAELLMTLLACLRPTLRAPGSGHLLPARILCRFFGIPRSSIFRNNTEMISLTCRRTKFF